MTRAALVVLLASVGLVTCASLPVTPVFMVDTLERARDAAETSCQNNRPIIRVRKGAWDSLEYHAMLAHEYTHVRQLRTHCVAKLIRYANDSAYMRRLEREAYCADAEYRLRAGQPIQRAVDRIELYQALYHDTTAVACHFAVALPDGSVVLTREGMQR